MKIIVLLNTIKTMDSYPAFMNHPLWDVIRIARNSNLIGQLRKMNLNRLVSYITVAVSAFYPISYASLLAFRRFSTLSDDPEVKAIANEIYLVECGERPIIRGSEYTGIKHCEQLKIMFESLFSNINFDIPSPENFEVLRKADIENADLVKSLAICDLIETTAPFVIHFYQDFLIQCQLALGRSSEFVKRNYLDEHNLTEGDTCELQHIEMLGRMKLNYSDVISSTAYNTHQRIFVNLVSQHFSGCLKEMEKS